jgi:uncharacterized membrane protein YbaN (DUF454 family)
MGAQRVRQADRRLRIALVRLAYRAAGILSLALGFVGLFLPLLPTVPFVLLAAFCFARGNPVWEARILADPRFGPHIRAWREHGSISRRGKRAAVAAFCASALIGFVFLSWPAALLPASAAVIGSTWILTRPTGR